MTKITFKRKHKRYKFNYEILKQNVNNKNPKPAVSK